MTAFLERRLARRFRAHDHDRNGFLERSDFGDGKLTASDQVRWMGSLMQVAEQDAREGFRRIDKDNDGLISGSDLVEAIGSASRACVARIRRAFARLHPRALAR